VFLLKFFAVVYLSGAADVHGSLESGVLYTRVNLLQMSAVSQYGSEVLTALFSGMKELLGCLVSSVVKSLGCTC